MSLLTWATDVLLMVIACRLLTFRRGASRHRWGVALYTWLMLVAFATVIVGHLTGTRAPASIVDLVIAMLVCHLVFRHRGNVAHMLRGHRS